MQCSCLVSLFNCLSFLGLREKIIKCLAFHPPQGTERELPLLSQSQDFHYTLEKNLILSEPSLSPRRNRSSSPLENSAFFTQTLHFFVMRNGQKTYGVLYKNLARKRKSSTKANKRGLVILFSHGNATEVSEMQTVLITFCLRLEVDVFAYEYTGYGLMEKSSPSEESLLFNIEGAYRYLREELFYSSHQIIVYGHSLGTVPSLYLCSNPLFFVQALILHSPMASGLRVVDYKLDQTSKNDFFLNIEMIPFVRCPIFIIHGEKDEIISIENAKLLTNASRTMTTFWWIKDCGHNNIIEKMGKEFYKSLKNFIKSVKNEEAKNGTEHVYGFNKSYEEFFRVSVGAFS